MKLALDKFGYLKDWQTWTPEVAEQLAKSESIKLSTHHWAVIHAAREFYQQYKRVPGARPLVNMLKQKLGEEVGNSTYIQKLFPKGVVPQAIKIAGLPKSKRCI